MTKKIIYGVLSALVFVGIWIIGTAGRRTEPERTEYPVVVLGDSILGLCRDETSIPDQLSVRLGIPVFNGAFGGTHMSMVPDGYEENYSAELLNMVNLSRAVAADDFGAYRTARSRRAVTEYFENTINELARVDFSKTEVLIMGFGVNDYHAGVLIEDPKAPMDVETYAGAMRDVIATIRRRFPNMRIILVTPTYTWYIRTGLNCEEADFGGGILERYVEAQIRVAEECQVEVVDLYHDLYPHETFEDWMRYTEDGLHPNEEARGMIADILAKRLAEEP